MHDFLFFIFIFIKKSNTFSFYCLFLILALIALPSERASLHEPGFASGRYAKHCIAARADYHSLGMAEYRRNRKASLALDIHEVRVGGRYEALELVLLLFKLCRWVEQVDVARENLRK
jgi:hypothetical protein